MEWMPDYAKAHQYLILLLMDVSTEDVRKDAPGSMMFADDIVLCGNDEIDMP